MRQTRGEGFGEEVKRRILIGTYVLSAGYYDAYYLKAQKVRSLDQARLRRGLRKGRRDADAGHADARVRARSQGGGDPIAMYLNDIFTVTVNMAGLPGLSVPGGRSQEGPSARAADHRQAVRRGTLFFARRK